MRRALLLNGNLGTVYKVTWAFEGDEMIGATRAHLWGLRMTAVSDHEELLQHLQRGTSTQKLLEKLGSYGKLTLLAVFRLKV